MTQYRPPPKKRNHLKPSRLLFQQKTAHGDKAPVTL